MVAADLARTKHLRHCGPFSRCRICTGEVMVGKKRDSAGWKVIILAALIATTAVAEPEWSKQNVGEAFTFDTPPGTVRTPVRGIDSLAGEFTNPKFVVGFDYGLYSNDLRGLRSDPRYTTEKIKIDSRDA